LTSRSSARGKWMLHGIELMLLLSLNAPAIQSRIARGRWSFRVAPMTFSRSRGQKGRSAFGVWRRFRCRTRTEPRASSTTALRGSAFAARSLVASARSRAPAKAVYYDLKKFWPFWSEVERVSAKRHRELGGAGHKSIARSRPPPKRPRSSSVTASGSYSCCPAQLCRSRVA
jgi:hypothetical protein